MTSLLEQLLASNQSKLSRVEIYQPEPVEEDAVVQEEDPDPTPE